MENLIQVDGKFYKKCKVVVLPNDTRYVKNFNNLYILSDDEIKEGDWCMNLDNLDKKWSKPMKHSSKIFPTECVDSNSIKKIIATTDKDLYILSDFNTNAGNIGYKFLPLPRPSDDFLKAYCKQGGIDKVLVEYEQEVASYEPVGCDFPDYEWNIKVAPDNTITIKELKENTHKVWIEDLFVPYNLAVKLREIGFDEKCFKTWLKEAEFRHEESQNSKLNKYNCSAPLWQQAFDWIREKHNLFGNMTVNQFGYGYMYSIIDDKRAEAVVYLTGGANHKMDFYKAREECLEKLVELIANKK